MVGNWSVLERTAAACLAVWAVGCAAPQDGGGAGPAPHSGGDTGEQSVSDEALLRAAISGEADPSTTLARIARQGGLPVRTDAGSHLFACLCGEGDWSLAGDHDDWAGSPMAQSGALWWAEVDLSEPDGSKYKYTAADAWIPDPLGRRYAYDEFGKVSLVADSGPHLEQWFAVDGFGLVPRDLHIWVPEAGTHGRTMYAHDGQNLFDPEAIWGGWRLHESAPAGMLIVGIENTPDRIDEYTHTTDVLDGHTYGGAGDAHADLLHEVIRPMVEAHYGAPGPSALMGSSLGGLISFHTAHRFPGAYDLAISLSGTMGWGSIGTNNPTMLERYAASGHQDTALYLDSGGSGTCWDADDDGLADDDPASSDNYCENAQFRDELAAAGYGFEVDLWHWHEPDAPHNEAAWADRVWRPLEIFAAR